MSNTIISGVITTAPSNNHHFSKKHLSTKTQVVLQELDQISDECKELLRSLPKEKGWRTSYLYKFQNFWCQPEEIQAIISFQNHFVSKNTDIVLASIPKSGTTWLKALTFAISKRQSFDLSSKTHPLLTSNPHDLVPFLEYKLYAKNQIPNLSKFENPRLFGTHVPYSSLEDSIKSSNCKIVYICRNPFDTFVSSWHFINKLRPSSMPPFSIEEAFDLYCKGIIGFGPFWEHMLGYWKQSLENPNKVLFLKYEDMKNDVGFQLKRLANFLGFPFTEDEERDGVVEEIAKLCSFENMKDLEVNKSGKSIKYFENKHLFRKAQVGDYVNYLSPSMIDQLSKIVKRELGSSGLSFKM